MTSILPPNSGIEKRRAPRRLAYVGEGLDAVLHLGEIKLEGHIIDLSAEGVGVIVPAEFIPESLTDFYASLLIKLEIKAAQVLRRLVNAKVVSCIPFHRLGRSYFRFGIHFQTQRNTHFSINERKPRRFDTSSLRPQAYFIHPLFFRETIHSDVIELSRSGLTCLTSLTNNTLIPNLVVRLKLHLPTKGSIELDVRLVSAKIFEGQIRLGFEILSEVDEFQALASEIIFMNNPDVMLNDLRSEGFPIESLTAAIKFRFAEASDLHQIWKFRYQMLQEEEGILTPSSIADVQEEHDRYSRHLMAFVHGKLVSVARLIFNNGVKERSEHSHYDVTIPDWLWKEGFVEAGRLLTHRDFRGTQIFLQMLQFVGLAAVGAGYRYSVLSSSTDLERIYLRVGCKLIARFTIPGEATQWSLYYMDMQKCVKGHHAGPLAWWFFHRPLLKIGTLKGWVKLNFFDKLRLSVYSVVGRAAAKLIKRSKARKK